MKHPLLKVQDKLSGTRKIRQLRTLTKSDFEVKEFIYAPAHCRADPEEAPFKFIESVHCSWEMRMRQEVIDHMMEVMNIQCGKGRDDKPLFPKREMLSPFCFSWNPEPSRLRVGLDRSIDYRGIPKKNVDTRQRKYQQVVHSMLNEWEAEKENYLVLYILELDEAVPKIIEESNRRFQEALEGFIVNLNVKEEWFLENEWDNIGLLRMKIDELNSQISKKKEQRVEAEKQFYQLRREMLVEHIIKDGDFSKETTEEVKRLAAEAPEIPPSRRRMFG